MPHSSHRWLALLATALAISVCVGALGRGYWTPDEPREADIAWRMSWQKDKAVPLLAGEAFCEKPPLTYWAAGAAMKLGGSDAWTARLPNLLYALVTALAVGAIGRRSVGVLGGWVAAAAITTFLLSYQVVIWLATDAPLLAFVAVALWGLYIGFYAKRTRERLQGYSCMHAALALGFLTKSAAAWMVPFLTLLTLVIWDKRWRELLRWELYPGLIIQVVLIVTWIAFVYVGPDGPAHIKVFFWNNLVGRFAHVDAPDALQYAAAHQNSPGKYLVELPVYLWPWALLVIAAGRAAWRRRGAAADERRSVRFGLATFVPTLIVLSVAATARNIYLAPALPGIALLLGWWAEGLRAAHDAWDVGVIRATCGLILIAVLVVSGAVLVIGADSWGSMDSHVAFVALSIVGLLLAAACVVSAWRAASRRLLLRGLTALVLAYCALLVGPASQIYGQVNAWQNLAVTGKAVRLDAAGRPIILFAPDETTRAFVDMYTRLSVRVIPAPVNSLSTELLKNLLFEEPDSLVLGQLPGRTNDPLFRAIATHFRLEGPLSASADPDPLPAWASASDLHRSQLYELPNGRRYALFEPPAATTSR